jgi:menaquinone-dependent protoporphyrinogen oxidase
MTLFHEQKLTRRSFLIAAGGLLGAAMMAGTAGCSIQPQAASLPAPEFIFGKEDTMPKRILVAYASAAGSTVGVAEALGKTLAARGLVVEVKAMKNDPSVENYQAVILGSAVHGGRWLPEAAQFVQTHQAQLKQLPVLGFCVHILNLGADQKSQNNRRAYLDPIRAWIPLADEVYFAGKGVDPDTASDFERFMAWIMHIPAGDQRDWEKINGWANEVKIER